MADIEILRQMLEDEAIVHPKNEEVVLVESDSSDKYEIKISDMPPRSVVFKADKLGTQSFFKGSKGENKKADFIIVAEEEKEKWVLHIEMKRSGQPLEGKIKKQLKSAACVVAYCRAVGRIFWSRSEFLNENEYQSRFIFIRVTGLAKRPTRRPSVPPQTGSSPDNPLTIDAHGEHCFSSLVRKAG